MSAVMLVRRKADFKWQEPSVTLRRSMQHFYCEVCQVTETVYDSTSMIYHRHNTVLTMLSAIPEAIADKMQTRVSKRTVARKVKNATAK